MTEYLFYIFFQQIPRATTASGSSGAAGRLHGRNQRARKALAPTTSNAAQPRFAQRETVAEAIRSLDAQFLWLSGAEG